MAEETVLAADQTAAPEAQPETPAREVAVAPEGAAPEAVADPSATPEPKEPPKPRKSTEAQLTGRVGYLTKTLHERDAELERLRLQNETMQALIGARQPAPADNNTPPAHVARAPQGVPTPGTPEFDQYVNARAGEIAANQAYEAEANRVNAEGRQKLGTAWDESLTALNAMGILQRGFVEAAFATGDPVAVLSALGDDLDEATRIAALPPHRMAAELTKMALKPATAAPAAPVVSRAPAPITTVTGAVNPTVDIYDPKIASGDKVSDDFLRARAKSGSPWHQRHKSA